MPNHSRYAMIVGGPRDGEVVPIVGQIMMEPVPSVKNYIDYFDDLGQPLPEDIGVFRDRVYRLEQRVMVFGPLPVVDNDIDLDRTQGWRYVLKETT